VDNYRLLVTSAEVIAVIRARHEQGLVVYSTFSDPSGTSPLGDGRPSMMTMYSMQGSDRPMFKLHSSWDVGEKSYERINEHHEYWLCLPLSCDECD